LWFKTRATKKKATKTYLIGTGLAAAQVFNWHRWIDRVLIGTGHNCSGGNDSLGIHQEENLQADLPSLSAMNR